MDLSNAYYIAGISAAILAGLIFVIKMTHMFTSNKKDQEGFNSVQGFINNDVANRVVKIEQTLNSQQVLNSELLAKEVARLLADDLIKKQEAKECRKL